MSPARLLALLLVLGAACRAETVSIPAPDGTMLTARLARPAAGAPSAPGVVALHGCGGAFPARDRQWEAALTGAGHAVLFPDSFGPRGLGSQCRVRDRARGYRAMRRGDALAAARWLAAQPGIPTGGVALLGWSDGGSTVLTAARAAADNGNALIRSMVALYPGCRGRAGLRPVAPLLILIGEADDWTPVAPCRDLARAAEGITFHAYPRAFHDFDAPVPLRVLRNIPRSQNADGSVHVGGDPAARADALERVLAFLRR